MNLLMLDDTAKLVYALLEQFRTDDDAPMTSPRNAEPGPGVLTLVQNDGSFAAASQVVTVAVQTTPAANDLRFYGSALARQAGLGVIVKHTPTAATTLWYGFDRDTAGNPENRISIGSLTIAGATSGGTMNQFGGFALNCAMELAIVLRPTGAYYLVRGNLNTGGGYFPEWTLIWVEHTAATATVYPSFRADNYAGSIDGVKGFRAVKFGGVWASAWGLAAHYSAASVNGQEVTGVADGITEHRITAATGVTQEILFRRTDDDNTLIVRMDQAGSTLKLISKSGGTETELNSVAHTWTNGTKYRIVIQHHGGSIRIYTDLYGVGGCYLHITRSSTFNQAVTGAKVSHAGETLAAWPMFVSVPASISTPSRGFLGIGDSKTGGTGDTVPTGGVAGYPRTLMSLCAEGENKLMESPARFGHGGYTMAQIKAVIDADIAACYTTPVWALLNIGANDVGSMPTEANYKTNLTYIVDALTTRWPGIQIYNMRIWYRGQLANCNILAGWNADVEATRGNCHAGPDERVFLEGGDDGATYTGDGIHPNAAGYVLTAEQWKTVLGL